MPRELMKEKRERAIAIAQRMDEHFPAAECALHYWGDPFKLTIAVLLSAQTTDKGVNKVTPALWERYPTPQALANADVNEVEEIIRTIGSLKLKEQGRAQPRGLVLFSPWTDMTASGKSYRTCKTLDPMLTMEYIAAVREAYTGPDADWSRPCYSPLFADLRGLPPTLVQVGTNEILKSDSERLVENLQKAGVYAQLEVYPECWHVFQQMPIRDRKSVV